MADAMLASTVSTTAIVIAAIAALALPLYQLRRDGFLRWRDR
jgi:hypothetical protein